jgi:ribosomal protein S19
MSRSKWKGPFFENNYYRTLICLKRLKTQARSSTITQVLLGKTIFIHMGNGYRKCTVTRDKLGFKIGDFSYTRKTFLGTKIKGSKSSKISKPVKVSK